MPSDEKAMKMQRESLYSLLLHREANLTALISAAGMVSRAACSPPTCFSL